MRAEAAARAESAAALPDLAGLRVLVVDDMPVNRVIVREMLGARGAAVAEAENGEQALSELHRAGAAGQPFELLVLDCRMPTMDGIEVMSRIQASYAHPIATVILTSDDSNISVQKLRQLGIQAFLVKPIRRADLYDAIASAIAQRRSRAIGTSMRGEAQAQTGSEPPRRILLADDSQDNQLLIGAYLKETPYRLDTAENGEIAVRMFASTRYDLILMDMQMPVMDGYEATREIRRSEGERGMSRTPIIALTASALKEDERKSLESGCDVHVPKPVKKSAMLAAIRNALQSRRIAD